ncbi:unnamed protein product [Periconia digitata]|uniref:Uncharacterized protein n=1 Tax=Periconia digitata TaxID=1303443 RepID=A0A9W4XJQ8_9PLEO|nr:unnamed protein product [Periconia digitata]
MDSVITSELTILRRQYLQLVDLPLLRWPHESVLKQPAVQSWIFHNLFDSDNITTLPPERYRLRVLKLLVSKLERAIDDPEEDVSFPLLVFYDQSYRKHASHSLFAHVH